MQRQLQIICLNLRYLLLEIRCKAVSSKDQVPPFLHHKVILRLLYKFSFGPQSNLSLRPLVQPKLQNCKTISKFRVLHQSSCSLTLWRLGGFGDFRKKNSRFRLPYQCPSSSADCARELFNGSNGSASLVDCTRKKFFGWRVRIVCKLSFFKPNHLGQKNSES